MNQRLRGINLGRTVLAGLNRRTSHHQTYSTRITSKRTATAGVAGLALAIPLTIYYVVYGRTLEAGREEEVYPAAIRRLLRAALMAEHGEEDQGTAARLFGEAYSAAKPLMAAGSLRWYDGAAIAIRWADLCERTGQRQAALLVLDNLIADLRSVWPLLALDERLRTIQIAQKLATLLSQPDPNHPPPPSLQTLKKIEDCLTFSVQEILHFLNRQDTSYREGPPSALPHDLPDSWHPSELSLQFASCFEALAKFYHERGQASYAMPLYLKTLSILLPGGATSGTRTETARCRAATVMNNIGQLLVSMEASGGGSGKQRPKAAMWLNQASSLARAVLTSSNNNSSSNTTTTTHHALVPPVGPLAECYAAFHAANHNLNALDMFPSESPAPAEPSPRRDRDADSPSAGS